MQDPFMYGYKSVEVLAANARGDKSKLPKDAIKYRIVTKDGGPDESRWPEDQGADSRSKLGATSRSEEVTTPRADPSPAGKTGRTSLSLHDAPA